VIGLDLLEHGECAHGLKVFLTDADYKHTLGATRALALEGAEVHVGSSLPSSLSFYSKYARRRFIYPDARQRLDFVNAIEVAQRRENYDAILPVGNEACYSLVTEGSDILRNKIPLPPRDSYLVACNKAKTLALARELEIPIPKTILPEEELELRISHLGHKLVVKRVLGSGDARVFHDTSEALAYCNAARCEGNPFVVQEFVKGEGYGFFVLYNRGKLRAFFMHRRVREVPPEGGPSSAAESVYVPELLALGSKILGRLSWHGVAMVEFRRDFKDGDFKLLEINPKFWGSLDLAIASGVNFPYLAATMVARGDVALTQSYKVGLKYCWPFPDDFRHFLEKPASVLQLTRDWADLSVGKNICLNDLAPQFCAVAVAARRSMQDLSLSRFRRILAAISPKPTGFSWVVGRRLAASARPRSQAQLVWLKRNGITAILNLTDKPLSTQWLESFGGIHYQIPMPDHCAPVLPRLVEAVDFLSAQIDAGSTVLVCCLGGLGRTGTVLAAYLVKRFHLTPRKAIVEVREKRPGSIEILQEASVVQYGSSLGIRSC
jgi:predicted ATP-grasp superfamily ATP-dependent carboligase